MKIPQDQKSKSEDIVRKFINETAEETNSELKKYLEELKKIKNEVANSASK